MNKLKKEFEFKKFWSIFKTEFRISAKTLIIWCAAFFCISIMYMLLHPSVQEMMAAKMDAIPPELMAIFGVNSATDITDYNSYFGMVYQIFLMVLCGYAVITTATGLHEEEVSGSIEFLNSCNISRTERYFAKFVKAIINVTLLVYSIGLASIICGFGVAKNTFDLGIIKNVIGITYISVLVFTAIGMLVAALSSKSKKASGIAMGIFMILYLIGYFSNIGISWLSWLKWFSPLHFLSASEIIESDIGLGVKEYSIIGIIIGIVIFLTSTAAGYFVYRRKDL